MPVDDDRLLVPGAFASRGGDVAAGDSAYRKTHLLEQANKLQDGRITHVWVVGSDVLNGGPNDWTLGKLTHQVGTVKPFVVNYNDGTTERYTAEPRRWGSAT
jgi:hypothetical protein